MNILQSADHKALVKLWSSVFANRLSPSNTKNNEIWYQKWKINILYLFTITTLHWSFTSVQKRLNTSRPPINRSPKGSDTRARETRMALRVWIQLWTADAQFLWLERKLILRNPRKQKHLWKWQLINNPRSDEARRRSHFQKSHDTNGPKPNIFNLNARWQKKKKNNPTLQTCKFNYTFKLTEVWSRPAKKTEYT